VNVTGNDNDDDDANDDVDDDNNGAANVANDKDDDNRVDVPVRVQYRRFNAEEEEALYLGAQQYGVGRWAEILTTNDGVRRRSRVALKDKWRTMVRQGRLEVLAGEFGPLRYSYHCGPNSPARTSRLPDFHVMNYVIQIVHLCLHWNKVASYSC